MREQRIVLRNDILTKSTAEKEQSNPDVLAISREGNEHDVIQKTNENEKNNEMTDFRRELWSAACQKIGESTEGNSFVLSSTNGGEQ